MKPLRIPIDWPVAIALPRRVLLRPAHHNQLGVIDPDREQGHRPRALARLGLLRSGCDRIVPPLAPLNGKDIAPLLPAQLLIGCLGKATGTTGIDTGRSDPHLRPGFVLEGLIEIVKKLVPDFGFKRIAPEDLMIEAPTFLAQPPADALELEAILLQAELLDLKADPERTAEGSVIEAQLDKGRGPVATVLVQTGTLKIGDIVVAGDEWGRVRALINDKGEQIKEAAPSTPVEVLGMQGTPLAGDRMAVVENEGKAREIADYRQRVAREKQVAKNAGQRGSLEQMMSQLQDTGLKEFPLLIKGDVQGSIEAIVGALDALGTDEVRARIVHSGAGAITESDVALAAASNAAIIGFNVRANKQARDASARDGIEIRYYNIIYDLVDDVKDAMSGLLSPERRETFLGNAEIREVFNITKIGKVAGCLVTEGEVERGAGVRLIRDNVVIHEGTLKTLKRFKDEVPKVISGQECGMAFERYEDIRQGDVIECFRVEHVARTL